MIPYTAPSFRFSELWKFFVCRAARETEALRAFRAMGARSIYVRKKQRYALASFLADLGWKGKKILVPAYTCRSVAEAVRASGNQPVFYDLKPDFTADLESLGRSECSGAAAVIVSDVYGIRMDIGPWLAGLAEKPLVIGDFAHHDFFGFDRDPRRYFDAVMYSTAYYKPMSVTDAGYLFVLSGKAAGPKDSIRLVRGGWPNLMETVKLYLTGRVLRSFWVRWIYPFLSASVDRKEDIARHSGDGAVSAALSQIAGRTGECPGKRTQAFDSYHRAFAGVRRVPASADAGATYFTIWVPEDQQPVLRNEALKKGVLLGRIFSDIAGKGDPACPVANEFARRAVNLPYRTGDPGRVVEVLRPILEKLGVK